MARNKKAVPTPVNADLLRQALAKSVATGDIVCLRFLFSPFSPGRPDTTERFEDTRYAYLLPHEEDTDKQELAKAEKLLQDPALWKHIEGELEARRPPQLPSALLLPLADNAVRLEKYSSAAQAYEQLRIRRRMQQEYFDAGNAALDTDDVPRAVRAYIIATGLNYDYSAVPEPLPSTPNFQTTALMLHGEYPTDPRMSLALQEPDILVNVGLGYLLRDEAVAAQLQNRPLTVRQAFLSEFVRATDPNWDQFVERYTQACSVARAFGDRLRRSYDHPGAGLDSLADQIEAQLGDDPRQIPALLLGYEIENGEWWQYLKELAYRHPAAALFVARQIVGEHEILVPRFRADSPVGASLGIDTQALPA